MSTGHLGPSGGLTRVAPYIQRRVVSSGPVAPPRVERRGPSRPMAPQTLGAGPTALPEVREER